MEWILHKFKLTSVNQVILIIIFAEFIFTIGASLIGPLSALFITQDVMAPVTAVGFAVAIYWIIKSILQLPIARYLDRNHGEVDDYYSVIVGLSLTTLAVYLYYFAASIWHIYALQIFIGIGDAFTVPAFFAIFTRHLDEEQEAYELALRSSFSYGAGSALGGVLSGILASTIGIRPIYLIYGTFLLIGTIILLFLRPYIKHKTPKDLSRFYDHKKGVSGHLLVLPKKRV